MSAVMPYPQFAQAVFTAAERPEVRDAVAQLYADVQQEIDKSRPVCAASGRCCRFEQFGHRLFITTAETAAFVDGLRAAGRSCVLPGCWNGSGCPFQLERLCGVHSIRPFGCRIFFCDSGAQDWQQRQYERFHARLRDLHEALKVPYFYVEWRQALRLVLEENVSG